MLIETVFIRPAQLAVAMQKLEVAGLHAVYVGKVRRFRSSNGKSGADGIPKFQKWLRLDVVSPLGSLAALFEGAALQAGSSWMAVPAEEAGALQRGPAVARESFIPPFSI